MRRMASAPRFLSVFTFAATLALTASGCKSGTGSELAASGTQCTAEVAEVAEARRELCETLGARSETGEADLCRCAATGKTFDPFTEPTHCSRGGGTISPDGCNLPARLNTKTNVCECSDGTPASSMTDVPCPESEGSAATGQQPMLLTEPEQALALTADPQAATRRLREARSRLNSCQSTGGDFASRCSQAGGYPQASMCLCGDGWSVGDSVLRTLRAGECAAPLTSVCAAAGGTMTPDNGCRCGGSTLFAVSAFRDVQRCSGTGTSTSTSTGTSTGTGTGVTADPTFVNDCLARAGKMTIQGLCHCGSSALSEAAFRDATRNANCAPYVGPTFAERCRTIGGLAEGASCRCTRAGRSISEAVFDRDGGKACGDDARRDPPTGTGTGIGTATGIGSGTGIGTGTGIATGRCSCKWSQPVTVGGRQKRFCAVWSNGRALVPNYGIDTTDTRYRCDASGAANDLCGSAQFQLRTLLSSTQCR